MANIIDIIVNATNNASSVLNSVGSGFDSLTSKAQKASGIIMGGLGIMGAGFAGIAVAGTKYNAMLESSDARWQTLTGSVEGANKQMDFIAGYAKSSPFDYQGIDETATSLMGMGMELQDVNKWIPTLGDMASVMGGGTETIKGVGVALGQMSAKGKVSAEEMGQLAERGVNGWQMIADAMGLSVGEVRKLSEDGKLLAKDALPMIQAGMAKTFGGGTATYMKSAKGQFDQIQEGASQLAGTLTSGAYEYFGTTVLPMVNNALTALEGHFSGGLVAGFQSLWDSSTLAKVAMTALAVVITGLLIGAFFLIAPAVASAVVAFAPFLAIGALVVGLVALIVANWGTIKPFFASIFSSLAPLFTTFKDTAMNSFQVLLAGVKPIWESFKTLITSLKPVITIIIATIAGILVVAFAVFNGVVQAIAPVIQAFLSLVDFVVNVVMTIVNLLTGNWSGAMASWNRATQSAVNFFKNIWQAIVGFFKGFVGTFVNILSGFGIDVVAKFKSMWENGKNAVTQGTAKMLSAIGKFIVNGIRNIQDFGKNLVNGFKNMWNSAQSAVSSGVAKVIKFFTDLKSKATASVKALGTAITSGFRNAMNTAKSAVSSGVSNIIGFYKNLGTQVISTIKSIASKLVSGFKTMMSQGASAVKGGVSNIISAVKGFGGQFLSAGKGLLEQLTSGIKSGIKNAVGAVKDGMSAIRDFLPFSPSKKGALRDLDKSGESFFPTWYEGALKQVPAMTRAVGGAMSSLNKSLQVDNGSVGLEAFTGGKSSMTVVHVHEHSGEVAVKGDAGRETFGLVADGVKETTENDVMRDLRQAIRKR